MINKKTHINLILLCFACIVGIIYSFGIWGQILFPFLSVSFAAVSYKLKKQALLPSVMYFAVLCLMDVFVALASELSFDLLLLSKIFAELRVDFSIIFVSAAFSLVTSYLIKFWTQIKNEEWQIKSSASKAAIGYILISSLAFIMWLGYFVSSSLNIQGSAVSIGWLLYIGWIPVLTCISGFLCYVVTNKITRSSFIYAVVSSLSYFLFAFVFQKSKIRFIFLSGDIWFGILLFFVSMFSISFVISGITKYIMDNEKK